MQATTGNLYGVTTLCYTSWGTIFTVTPGGALTTLYNFCSQTGCADGYAPFAGLVQAADGNFYGTTIYGGHDVTGCDGSIVQDVEQSSESPRRAH